MKNELIKTHENRQNGDENGKELIPVENVSGRTGKRNKHREAHIHEVMTNLSVPRQQERLL